MKRLVTALGIVCLGLTLTACSGSAAGSCTTAHDVAAKVSTLGDDLRKAQGSGKIDALQAGEIGARILSAGKQYGTEKNHRSYCEALDNIRKSAGL